MSKKLFRNFLFYIARFFKPLTLTNLSDNCAGWTKDGKEIRTKKKGFAFHADSLFATQKEEG